MFTGIVREIGRVLSEPAPSGRGGHRLGIGFGPALGMRLEIGASLAVDGVCLTVTELEPARASVELSPETLRRTKKLGTLRRGDAVDLEPALRLGDALGGHSVQGHVDGTLRVVERRDLSDHRELAFALSPEVAPYRGGGIGRARRGESDGVFAARRPLPGGGHSAHARVDHPRRAPRR